MENPATKNLLSRLIRVFVLGFVAVAFCLFVPGTVDFWQGWAFLAVTLLISIFFCVYYYRRDPEFLARRLLRKETIPMQWCVLGLAKVTSMLAYVLCGLDHRLGWSRTLLAPVPLWLTTLALFFYGVSYLLFIPVCNANRFAASTIQIEAGQTVADRGPYRLVRHPMYAVALVVWFWIPLALGSFVLLPLVVLMAAVLALRLLNEEKMLRRELPGYVEYCQRTRWRLVPFVW